MIRKTQIRKFRLYRVMCEKRLDQVAKELRLPGELPA